MSGRLLRARLLMNSVYGPFAVFLGYPPTTPIDPRCAVSLATISEQAEAIQ
jgi:hypothetical protein